MNSGRIQNIQALRALAAISVAFYHTGLGASGLHSYGSFGVALFFVISGFVIARAAEREDPWTFSKRRLIRIVPPYWIATFAAFVVYITLPGFLEGPTPTAPMLMKSLLFIPQIRPDGQMKPVLFVGWSLNYEMLFYGLVAVGIVLLGKRGALFAVAVIPAFFLVPLFAHGLLARAWSNHTSLYFCVGAVAYYLNQRFSTDFCRQIRYSLLTITILCIPALCASELLQTNPLIPGGVFAPPLMFVLVLGSALLSRIGWDLQYGWVSLLGDSSYALYLLHPFVEPIFKLRLNLSTSVSAACLAVAASAAVSVLVYRFAEKPLLAALAPLAHRSSNSQTRQTVPAVPKADSHLEINVR